MIDMRHLLHVLALVALVVLVVFPITVCTGPPGTYQKNAPRQNLVAFLRARHGITVAPADLLALPTDRGAFGLEPVEYYFLGRPKAGVQSVTGEGERAARDVYFSHFILSDAAIPVHASPLFSLSKTKAADEHDVVFDGQRYLAFGARADGVTTVVTVLDLAGMSPGALSGLSRLQRLQQQLTNFQDTGLLRGLDRLEVRLNVPENVALSWRGQVLEIRGTESPWIALVNARTGKRENGPISVKQVQLGKRSFIAWAVDTVRNLSFVGPERIAWLEELVYGVVDRARRMSGSTVTAAEIKDEMDLPIVGGSAATVEGWPPPPLKPMLPGPLPGEGRWVEVRGPFLRARPGLPAYFAMTFIRPDAERLFSKVYFVAWDPRRIDLRMAGGTREPHSETGQHGEGMIPRDPKVIGKLVAAFNGGFQSVNGDFGMLEARKLYAPPKPYAATVARLVDGRTGMGTWDGQARGGNVPEWLDSFRQNLTALVEDGRFNPWERGSWGGGAGLLTGSGPKAYVIRSGICLHKSGHMMYVQGDPVDGPTLGRAMHHAGCDYGMETDINRGHVGLEFFNIRAPNEALPEGGGTFQPMRYFSARGSVPGVAGYTYFMREIVRDTGNSPVPRWLGREARDFFYLVERDLMPVADVPPLSSQANEGRWTTAHLPPPLLRFPQAIARTVLYPRPGTPERRIHLVLLDLRWLDVTLCVPAAQASCLPTLAATRDPAKATPDVVIPLGLFPRDRALVADGRAIGGTAAPGTEQLVLETSMESGPTLARTTTKEVKAPGAISFTAATPGAPSSARSPATATALTHVQSSVCLTQAAHQLLYATGLGVSSEDLNRALTHAGCRTIVALGSAPSLLTRRDDGYQTMFGSALPPLANTPSLLVRRKDVPFATRIFTHVKPVPRRVWTAVQPERTRATALRQAQRVVQALGLPPVKNLNEICGPPYTDHAELRKLRWRDPLTGVMCGMRVPATDRKQRGGTPN